MAAINRTHSTQFLDDMLRRRDRINFTSTLLDRRQWPTLGQAVEVENKKKSSVKSENAKTTSSSSTSVSVPRAHLHSISSSTGSNFADSEQSSSGHDSPSNISQSSDHITLCKQNSTEINRKKVGKTKWVPMELPQPSLPLHERLRQKRRQELGLPPVGRYRNHFSQYSHFNGPRNADVQINSNVQNSENGQRMERRPEGGNQQRRPMLNNSQIPSKPRNVMFSRKMFGARNKNVMYDTEYNDQRSDGTADDVSVAHGYWEDGYYYAGSDGCPTPIDWNYYGVDSYGMYGDNGYDVYGYFNGMDGSTFNGMYYTADGNAGEDSPAALKNLIKGQIEYYFSQENLQKDLFLRRNMSEHGWVDIGLLASFQRVQRLTKDFGLIHEAISESNKLEVNELLVRSRDHPEMWPITDKNAHRFAAMDDHSYVEHYAESQPMFSEELLSGYRLYEGGKPCSSEFDGSKSVSDGGDGAHSHIWDEGESGQFDGDYTVSGEEEDEEVDVSEIESSGLESPKLAEEMSQLSVEVA